jgi:hypothetical protein
MMTMPMIILHSCLCQDEWNNLVSMGHRLPTSELVHPGRESVALCLQMGRGLGDPEGGGGCAIALEEAGQYRIKSTNAIAASASVRSDEF